MRSTISDQESWLKASLHPISGVSVVSEGEDRLRAICCFSRSECPVLDQCEEPLQFSDIIVLCDVWSPDPPAKVDPLTSDFPHTFVEKIILYIRVRLVLSMSGIDEPSAGSA